MPAPFGPMIASEVPRNAEAQVREHPALAELDRETTDHEHVILALLAISVLGQECPHGPPPA